MAMMTTQKRARLKKKARLKIRDQLWRLENLYFIKDKEGKEVRFKLNIEQRRFLGEMHCANIILKARQLGFTTLSCLLFLDTCLFKKNVSAGIIAHNLEDANSFFTDKIKFAYDRLPDDLKQAVTASTDKVGEYRFSNGSKLSVRTSFRSGTLQLLLISEFGKICAKNPEKAKEIVSGALNAIQAGQTIIIESTAEGRAGYFFDYCEIARTKKRLGSHLTPLDFKFHFFSWWESPDYQLDPMGVIVPQEMEEYFATLELEHSIKLNDRQKAWYIKKAETQKEEMKKEFPSHPDEAFAQSIVGSYYGALIAKAEKEKRIGVVPWEPRLKVHVAWDLGISDSMALWFFQLGPSGERRYIDYYENSGEALPFYAQKMREGHRSHYVYGKMLMPHDAEVRNLETGKSRVENLQDLGFRDIVVIPNMPIAESINAARNILPQSWFDEAKCGDGLKCIRSYRKAWDDKGGCWKDSPLHDWSSHGASAFSTSALADVREVIAPSQKRAHNKFR